MRVRRSPRSRRRSFLPRRMAVQPRPRRLPLRPGRAARRPRRTLERRRAVPAGGEQELPELDSVQTEGAAQPLFDRTEHMPVKVGEADTLGRHGARFCTQAGKGHYRSGAGGSQACRAEAGARASGKAVCRADAGEGRCTAHRIPRGERTGHEAASGALRDAGIHAARQPQRRDPGGRCPGPSRESSPGSSRSSSPDSSTAATHRNRDGSARVQRTSLQQLRLGLLGVEAE